jgi:hypothetical protein
MRPLPQDLRVSTFKTAGSTSTRLGQNPDLSTKRCVYSWAEGIYLQAGLKTASPRAPVEAMLSNRTERHDLQAC